MKGQTAFVRVLGSSPRVKLLDFLLQERGLYDYSLTEIAKYSGVSWATLQRMFPKLIELKIVEETREISRAKLYRINEKNDLVKYLTDVRMAISDFFIHKELKKQDLKFDVKPEECLKA